jgi:hypothetical protein
MREEQGYGRHRNKGVAEAYRALDERPAATATSARTTSSATSMSPSEETHVVLLAAGYLNLPVAVLSREGVAAVRTIASSKDVSLTPKPPVRQVTTRKELESA